MAQDLTDPNVIIQHFQRLQSECQQLAAKLAEFEHELSEHELVIQQLKPLDSDRRAYRLVGGVLVERTVGEVLPVVEANVEGLKQFIKQFGEALERKEQETRAWKEKYNIRSQTAKEIRAQQQVARAEQEASGGQGKGGVLA